MEGEKEGGLALLARNLFSFFLLFVAPIVLPLDPIQSLRVRTWSDAIFIFLALIAHLLVIVGAIRLSLIRVITRAIHVLDKSDAPILSGEIVRARSRWDEDGDRAWCNVYRAPLRCARSMECPLFTRYFRALSN